MNKGTKLLTNYLFKQWRFFIPALIFIIASAFIQAKIPVFVGEVSAKMAESLGIKGISNAPQNLVDQAHQEFLNSAFNALGIICLMGVLLVLQNLFMSLVASFTTRNVRLDLFEKLQSLSIRYFDEHSDGEIMSRFTNDVDNISNLINQSFTQLFANIFSFIFVTVIMLQSNTKLAGYVIFAGAISVVISAILAIRSSKYVRLQQSKLGALNGYLDERITGQKLIYSYGLDDLVHQEFNELNEDYKKNSTIGQTLSNVILPLMEGTSLVTLAVIIFLSVNLLQKGEITFAVLIAFSQFVPRFFQPLSGISSQFNIMQLGFASATRVAEVLTEQPEILESNSAVKLTKITDGVELINVDFGYNSDKLVLKNINLKVEKGTKVALVGPTGSGKSTIMNLLNRFYDVNKGEILINKQNIKNYHLESLRKKVGIILQESVLFSGTIAQNIAYSKPNTPIQDIKRVATEVGINEFIESLPDGYNTKVTNASSILSTGQKQLISIARTMLSDPEFLIMDEATSNVDTVTEEYIQVAMKKVLEGRTSFVIAHRLKTILDADTIIVLKDGEIIEQGNHHELLKLNGFYAELYHNQFVVGKVE